MQHRNTTEMFLIPLHINYKQKENNSTGPEACSPDYLEDWYKRIAWDLVQGEPEQLVETIPCGKKREIVL